MSDTDLERTALAGGYLDTYLDLKADGVPWKKAYFAAWFNAPKRNRQPGTLDELATELRVSRMTLDRWRHQEWFKKKGVEGLRERILVEYLPDVDRKTINAALAEDGSAGVAARRLFYEQARLAAPVEVDVTMKSWLDALKKTPAYGDDDGEMAESGPEA